MSETSKSIETEPSAITSMPSKTNEITCVFVIASDADSKCGVYDYTARLAEELRRSGIKTDVAAVPSWSWKAVRGLQKRYGAQSRACFHLQYPSLGMGKSLLPGLLPLLWPNRHFFLTLHEFTYFHVLRKLAFLPHALFARKIIFSNAFERSRFLRFFPFATHKTEVIPIGNNIEVLSDAPVTRQERLVYFGQIAEGKGIEFFIETVELLRKSGSTLPAAIIGAALDEKTALFSHMQRAAQALDIALHLNLPAEDVSKALLASSTALLPFPDGISEKRGSALACLKHGLNLITLHSAKTPDWLRRISHNANTPEDAVKVVDSLQKGQSTIAFDTVQDALKQTEWPHIAQRHIALYSASCE